MSSGPLNLADADLSGFDALDSGRYNAVVHAISMDAVKNEGGKMPIGTPILKFEFRLTDEGTNNRHAWTQFVIPPKDYDKAKASKIKGMIARAFIALGDNEEVVKSKDFNPDFEDYLGRECVVVLGKEQKRTRDGEVIPDEYNNPVKGIKPAGSLGDTGDSGGLL